MNFLLLLDNIKNSIGYSGKGDFISNSKIFPAKIFRKQDMALHIQDGKF